MQGDQFGDAGRALAAFDLDHEMIVDAQAVRRHVLGFSDGDPAAELGPKGIRVHAISPGPLATRAASGIPEFDELMDKAQSKAPARSLVSIDDVGNATAFLALDGAKLITGGVLYIDGGYNIID